MNEKILKELGDYFVKHERTYGEKYQTLYVRFADNIKPSEVVLFIKTYEREYNCKLKAIDKRVIPNLYTRFEIIPNN